MSSTEIIHAYRHLYRELLRAVRYATPARYTARDQIRRAFRESGEFDKAGVKRTMWFLKAAAKETGMEHKILKNLLKVAWHRNREGTKMWRGRMGAAFGIGKGPLNVMDERELMHRHYDMTIRMLNKSMGLCLR